MTKRRYTQCDCCGEKITDEGLWATFKRKLLTRWKYKLRKWKWSNNTRKFQWKKHRFDLCGDCLHEIIWQLQNRTEESEEEE